MRLLLEYPHLKTIQALARRRKVQLHLVGGCLRDYVIGRSMNDFDFAANQNALKLAEAVSKELKGSYILLDEERGCARVTKKVKGEILTFDFSEYRADSFAEDLDRRDFTINTLSVDFNQLEEDAILGDVIVARKTALKDIKDKRIRRVSVRAFRDDPLRMMRAFGLRANLDFVIELKTLNQIRKEKELIKNVSYERIREELFKVFESSDTAEILKSMDRVGLLENIIPQIQIMKDCKQGGYHHLDVWPHSLEVVHQLDLIIKAIEDPETLDYLNEIVGGGHSRKSLMKLGALLHDIGKPDTRQKKGERLSFHGHENVGRRISTGISKMLRLSTKERHILEDMVQMHLRPGYLSNFKKPSERMIYRFFRDAKKETVNILLLSLADQRSTRGPLTTKSDQKHHENICVDLIERYFEQRKAKPYVPLIDGNYLMKSLKMKSSPMIGTILREVQEQHVLGKIKSKREALVLARKLTKV